MLQSGANECLTCFGFTVISESSSSPLVVGSKLTRSPSEVLLLESPRRIDLAEFRFWDERTNACCATSGKAGAGDGLDQHVVD